MNPNDELIFIENRAFVSSTLAAQIVGVTVQSLTNYKKRVNPPPYDPMVKMYPLDELGDWIRREQIYMKGKGGNYPFKPDFTRYDDHVEQTFLLPGMEDESQKERYERLRGDKLEMEIQEKAGKLVDVDLVHEAMTSMVSRVKTRLLSIPTHLAPVVTSIEDRYEVQTQIDNAVKTALEELSADYNEVVENDED